MLAMAQKLQVLRSHSGAWQVPRLQRERTDPFLHSAALYNSNIKMKHTKIQYNNYICIYTSLCSFRVHHRKTIHDINICVLILLSMNYRVTIYSNSFGSRNRSNLLNPQLSPTRWFADGGLRDDKEKDSPHVPQLHPLGSKRFISCPLGR